MLYVVYAEIQCESTDEFVTNYFAASEDTAFESRVKVICKTGHMFKNGSTELLRICLSNGNWSLKEKCMGKKILFFMD